MPSHNKQNGNAMEEQESDPCTEPTCWITLEAIDGTTFSFATPSAGLAYLSTEVAKWNWVSQAYRGAEVPAATTIIQKFRQLTGRTTAATTAEGADAKESAIQRALEYYLAINPAIHDRSAFQKGILDVADRNPPEGFWTLVWLTVRKSKETTLQLQAIQQQDAGFLLGLANATLLAELHSNPTIEQRKVEALDTALADSYALKDKALRVLQELESTQHRTLELQSSAEAEAAIAHQLLSETRSKLTSDTDEAIKTNRDSLEAKWKQLTSTYDQSLALRAPSKYWKSKQLEHTRLSQAFGIALIIVSITGALILAAIFGAIFGGTKANQIPTWGQVLSATVGAVLLLWVIKTLVRLTLSHVHLALDAEERRTMILSYLAMSRLSDATAEERKALLAAIFRPTGDGIVKDESPPIPLLELLKAGKGTA